MLRSTLIVAAGALMFAVIGNAPAGAGGYESPIVRYRPSNDPVAVPIPAPYYSPRWQYSAAYYNRPRGPRYFQFMGAGQPQPYRWWWRRR